MASPQEDGRRSQAVSLESRVVASAMALPEDLTREERAKHLLAEQISLGPLADNHVTSVRYRLPAVYQWDDGSLHYGDGKGIDDGNPFNDQAIKPTNVFSSHEEYSELVGRYGSNLSEDERGEIAREEEAARLGREWQEEIWAMEIAARDRILAKERNKTLAAEQEVADASKAPRDVFVAEGFDEQRAA